MKNRIEVLLAPTVLIRRQRMIAAAILLFCVTVGYAADSSTNRPKSKISGLLPKRQTANSADAAIRDQTRNGAMLSATTNAAVNTRRVAQLDVTFEPAARDVHSTVHRSSDGERTLQPVR